MGRTARFAVLPLLVSLLLLLLHVSPSLGAKEQVDCSATDCTSCLDAGVQCAWCYNAIEDQHCYNTVSETCPGLTLRYSCIQEDTCYQQVNCAECAAFPICGWCDTACVLGTSTGPNAPNIQCTQWTPPGTYCNATCSDYAASCAVCESQPTCNWCLNDKTCQDADDHSSCFDWAPECPDICSGLTSCVDCTANEACTWCENEDAPSSCVPSASNPGINCNTIYTKFCDDTCVGITSCSQCASNPACGWCDTRCVQGNDEGPFYNIKCNNWIRGSCTVPFTCESTLSCEECNAGETCCYDANSRQCIYKTPSGNNCSGRCPSKDKMSGVMIFFVVLLSLVSAAAVVAGFVMWYKFYWQRRHYFQRLA